MGGAYMGPKGAIAGAIAGRTAASRLGKSAKRAWGAGKRAAQEAGAAPPIGTPLSGTAKVDRKAAAAARKAERAAQKEAKRAAKQTAEKAAPKDLDPELARNVNMADTALRDAQRGGDPAKISKAKAAYEAALKAAGQNLHTIAGAGLVGASAFADDETQTQGAAAASAGLLLLLLPRNIGRRAAFRQLEEAAATAARRVPGTELPHVRQALEAAREQSRAILRDATAPGSTDWTPAELIEMQSQAVRQVYADAMPHNVWRAGNYGGRMTDDALAYVRAELARQNAGWVNGDAALRRAYDETARELDIAERAPRGDNPSPRVQRLERVGSLQPERAARLEHDARRAFTELPAEAQSRLRQVMNNARDELAVMARRYVSGQELSSGLARSSDDLIAAQVGEMANTWERLGLDLPPHLSAVEIQNAAEAEIRRLNASIAQQNMPTRIVEPEAPPAAAPVERQRQRIVEFIRNRAIVGEDVARAEERLFENGWTTPEVAQARRAVRGAEPELETAFQTHVSGRGRYRVGDEDIELMTASDLAREQRRIIRERFASEAGIRVDAINPDLDQYINAALVRFNADAASSAVHALPDPGDDLIRARIDSGIEQMARGGETMASWNVRRRVPGMVSGDQVSRAERLVEGNPAFERQVEQAGENAAQSREYKAAERERNLKPPNPDERPAMVDGIPTDAAIRLDDALHDDLERLTTTYEGRRANNARSSSGNPDEVMLQEELPAFEERARQFARDNPNLISEDDAVGYARRRWEEIGDEEAGFRLREDGGHARAELAGDVDDEMFDDAINDALQEQISEVDYRDEYDIQNASVDTDAIIDAVIRRSDLTPRQERRLRQLVEDQESNYQRYMDEDLRERHEEWRGENPDSEPDSAPDSDEGWAEQYRRGGVDYRRGDSDGLPSNEELEALGLKQLEVDSNSGVENVFGRALSTEEVEKIFSLKYLREYAERTGRNLQSNLTVTSRRAEFVAGVGSDFRIEVTYQPGVNGLEVHYGFMRVPPEFQGSGMGTAMVKDMVEPLETLGAEEVNVGAAWLGKYTWLKLGLQPDELATKRALNRYKHDLIEMVGEGHPAVAMSMDRIKNTKDLADAWLPKQIVEERLPELKQGWEELRHLWGTQKVNLQPFEEAVFRTSRSGNEQFLSGKYFLIMREGDWNSGLRLEVAPGTAWYDDFKARLGMAGAGAIGFGLTAHELFSGFEGADMTFAGVGAPKDESPDEVAAYMAEQEARAEKVDRTREKLGYLKTETEVVVRDTARAIANAHPRARIVSGKPGVTNSKGVGSFLGSHATLREAFDDKRKTLETLQRDPMALVDELTEGLGELQDTAPGLHAQMVQQTYKVVDFLHKKLPVTVGASLTRPEGSPTNQLAIRQFALYYSAATDPNSVMGDIANNRVQKEQIDTLKEMWPEVYTDLKVALVDQLSKGRPTVAQRQRLDLLFDFGDSLDRGLSNRLVGALNQYRAKEGANDNAAPPTTPQRRSQPSVVGTSALAPLGYGPAAGPGTLA